MPVIGITSAVDYKKEAGWLGLKYAEAILAAGGLPLVLPNLPPDRAPEVLSVVQGVLLSGGGDLGSFYLEENPHPSLGEIDPQRDVFELALTREALRVNKPILGICRGVQVLAVVSGGKITQHLEDESPSRIQHNQIAPHWYSSHKVEIAGRTLLYDIIKKREIKVNSFHHQAVVKVPPGFQSSASAPDGVIEALESSCHSFVLGLQWHPEILLETEKESLLIFKEFVAACV